MAALQPRYPAAMIRREVEGSVTVRVRVNEQGRVTQVQKVSAVHDDLFEATRRHALRRWRFLPATRNGSPIASWKEVAIEFRIT